MRCGIGRRDDGKKRGVRADTEGEGEDSDGGKARRFAEHARGVAQVLHKSFEPAPAPLVARSFSNQPFIAQFAASELARGRGLRRARCGPAPPSLNDYRVRRAIRVAYATTRSWIAPFGRRYDACDGLRNLLPARLFMRQLPFAGGCQSIHADALLVLRGFPFGLDPALALEAMQAG